MTRMSPGTPWMSIGQWPMPTLSVKSPAGPPVRKRASTSCYENGAPGR